MIQLLSDCLLFQTAKGETIPCSAESVIIELMGDAAAHLEPDLIQNAAHAVLHYFKHDLGRDFVTVSEFSEALEKTLRGLGLTIESVSEAEADPPMEETDLLPLAWSAGPGFELAFFQQLRRALHRQLQTPTEVVRFRGLRHSVKYLVGAKRWDARCRMLQQQIVLYLRHCLRAEAVDTPRTVVVH